MIIIRLAKPEEAELIGQIEDDAAEAFRGSAHSYVLDDPAAPAKFYAKLARKRMVFMAEVDGRSCGFAAMEVFPDALHLKELAVRHRQQRRGIGRALVEAVLAEARRRGLPAVTLTTFEDLPWNGPWYARLGFEVLGAGQLGERLRAELAEEFERGLSARCAMRLKL